MRIIHLVVNLERGGLERVVIDLVRAQAALGHDPMVVCLMQEGQLAPELGDAGIGVRACHKRGGFDLRAMRRIRRAVRDHRAEVLHTHNAMPHYYGVAATIGQRLHIINTRHGAGAGLSKRLELLYRAALVGTQAVATVSEQARASYLERGILPAELTVALPNGIPLDRFTPRSEQARRALLEELGLPADAVVVGTVGRLHPIKDHESLLEAVAELPSVALVIVGGGESEGTLRRRVEALGLDDRVRLLGDRSDVPALLASFDIFALSSLTEGYSIALVEAAASALPIVATDVGGNAQIVQDGVSGKLVEKRRPAQLATALASLVDRRALRERMGTAARRWAVDHGSVQAMAERYEQLYRFGPALR